MKDLLVAIDDSDSCRHRLAVVQKLATRFDSHITGIHVSQIKTDYTFEDRAVRQQAVKKYQNQIADEKSTVSDLFYNSLSLSKNKSSFFSEQTTSAYYELANINDLIVVSQTSPDLKNTLDRGSITDLIMRSGRPVLLLPYVGGDEVTGLSVLVAWDNSREACRAVHDSLSLLKEAKEVHIVSVSEPSKPDISVPNARVSEHLARHDVNVIVHEVIKNEVPVAETLLSLSADYGIDMLVMGGYGHSRMREFVFGGVTKTILDSMTIPVLMSH